MTAKTAIVTGSTSGIGLGIAEALAHQGYNVVLNGFGDPQAIETTRAKLEETTGVAVRYNPADMSKPDAIVAMIDRPSAVKPRIIATISSSVVSSSTIDTSSSSSSISSSPSSSSAPLPSS